MNTKINQHHDVPPTAPQPTHNSGTVRSTPAGGQVSKDQYQQPRDQRHGFDTQNK